MVQKPSNQSVAFIGLGVMGYPMALNLYKKLPTDWTLFICDTNDEVKERFKQEAEGKAHIQVAKHGAHAARYADILISVLPDGETVRSVYLDKETGCLAGIKGAVKSGHTVQKILVECGTIESAAIEEVGKKVRTFESSMPKGCALNFVDAPVSGGPMAAENGSLAFMVGIDRPENLFGPVKRILRYMGQEDRIFLCGKVGAGTSFKIINNYISAITSLASSEALNIGVKLGYDAKTLTRVINASSGQNWATSRANPVPGVQDNVPSSRGYEGGFRIELCMKVLEMGSELAKKAGARTVLDGPTLEAFEEAAADKRYKGKDARVVYKWLSESSVE